ncbi:farnesyl cysteine-carboxyl methyltransferase [Coniothyrium glycines]
MSDKLTASSSRLRTSEDKLFQACLNACIHGIENIVVDKWRASTVRTTPPQHSSQAVDKELDLALESPCLPSPPQSPPPPPPPPQPDPSLPAIDTLQQSLSSAAAMNRASLHRAPSVGRPSAPPTTMRGPNSSAQQGGPLQGSRHAQTTPSTTPKVASSSQNLAVQQTAHSGALKLKKKAVKVVGAASPASLHLQLPSSVPSSHSQASVPVMSKPQESESLSSLVASEPSDSPADTAPKDAETRSATELELDDIFARLMTSGISATQDQSAKSDMTMPSFQERVDMKYGLTEPPTSVPPIPSSASPRKDTIFKAKQAAPMEPTTSELQIRETTVQEATESSQADIEAKYLRLASKYVDTLMGKQGTAASTIRDVARKLHETFSPDSNLELAEMEKLKARFAFAVVNYCNNVVNKGNKTLTIDFVKQTLKDNDGNFLHLCATLVEQKFISLDNINEVGGLGKTMLDILPKPEATPIATSTHSSRPNTTTQDGIGSIKTWPSQEKRENRANQRTCVLKGVSGITSISRLQALVWGGRIEALQLPEPGSNYAIVRFLTPEGCQTYFQATENGIETGDESKTIIFVEKTEGPNSINDNIQAAIDGNITRCVRAVGMNDEWSNSQLLKLARGTAQRKREVDRIKRNTNARGHKYIEFRFANIMDAISFMREIRADEDWEHCTTVYAPDPCETAQGVHVEGDDEGSDSFSP